MVDLAGDTLLMVDGQARPALMPGAWAAPDPCPRPPFPPDARARVYRRAPSPTSSGRARTRRWVLELEPRSAPWIEPVMGWTAGEDPLTQVRLEFPTLGAALRYAARQGLPCEIDARPGEIEAERDRATPGEGEDQLLTALLLLWAWQNAAYGGRRGDPLGWFERALASPAELFRSPDEVVRHPLLSRDQKRLILRRWAWDERLQDLATDEAMPEARPSRLDEVEQALIALERQEPAPAGDWLLTLLHVPAPTPADRRTG